MASRIARRFRMDLRLARQGREHRRDAPLRSRAYKLAEASPCLIQTEVSASGREGCSLAAAEERVGLKIRAIEVERPAPA